MARASVCPCAVRSPRPALWAVSATVLVRRKLKTLSSPIMYFAPSSTAPCAGASPSRPMAHMSARPNSAVATFVSIAGSAMVHSRRVVPELEGVAVGWFTGMGRSRTRVCCRTDLPEVTVGGNAPKYASGSGDTSSVGKVIRPASESDRLRSLLQVMSDIVMLRCTKRCKRHCSLSSLCWKNCRRSGAREERKYCCRCEGNRRAGICITSPGALSPNAGKVEDDLSSSLCNINCGAPSKNCTFCCATNASCRNVSRHRGDLW